ncbi:MAG: hypothetical protein Q7J98_06855 [Kiritimatiellia bacterium]|nr:hypothetical protein [Kiritimatiellia bacterium]
MIHWFIKRGRMSALLLTVPVAALVFVLLNTAGSTQSSEMEEDFSSNISKDYEEVFFAVNPADFGDVYIQWDMPKSTTTEGQYNSACTNWFLGAYKRVSEYGPMGVDCLCVALDRTMLPISNLEYTIHYFDAENSFLFLDLLAANGLVIAENLYGNLLDGSGEDRVISLDVPLASDAAVIQLRCGAGEATVYESRIYVEGYESRLTAAQESCNSESEHNKGVNDSDAVSCIYPAAAQTATGHENLREAELGDSVQDKSAMTTISQAGTIYIDQTIGDDWFTGRSPVVSGQDGPKKTIRNGLTAADEVDTLIIKSGVYDETLELKDKDINVFIEGNVRL